MPVTKAQQRAVGKYEKENYDKVLLRLPKGNREKIKAHAQQKGMSLNAYIVDLIEKDMRTEEDT
ncbi:MAG: Arc family DNA-binding protein [Flavonifractor plautii]|jgi:predicted HicB family RNase H-like nuclease|uniref:Arc family DNA-binding protein n=1 Tax=Flavonifractor plautii TaxID=292800 RepID=UPI001D007E48|nr:Arc family DNA-binding protein [Flavonifractor plautii]MCB5582075.1 Arc family DNA-binding protein [Flavonifractor plautii]